LKRYGTISFDSEAKAWRVECEPHVALRLKRVFAGLGKAAKRYYLISDTLDNARDLEWFIDRYPMVVTDSSRLRERACEHIERMDIVSQLLENRQPVKPFSLAFPPRDYQSQAAALLLARGSLLLADDVGIGKTLVAICTFTDPRTLPAVVVTLTHLPRQWQDELKMFAPNLTTHIIKKGTPYDLTAGRKDRNGQITFADRLPDVIIMNYHKLAGWAETLARVARSVTYDECQELRRRSTNTARSLKYESAMVLSAAVKFRLGLSASPIYNYGAEMHSVMDCIAPGALGTLGEFSEEWCAGRTESVANPKAFSFYLRDSGMMLRRTRQEVGRELPEVSKIVHYVDADAVALQKVSASCAELARMILRAGEENRGDKMRASEELSNVLRQATGIAKAPYVAEFVKLLLESERKIVLYGWHRAVYDIWLDQLKEFKPVLYTGTESPAAKEASKHAFVSGDSRLMIISLRSGAGLDGLQKACRTVVFGELDWSPGVHLQNVGRVHRDGQPDPVAAYFLVSDFGSDPVVTEILGLKRQQSDAITDPNLSLIETLEADPQRIKKLAASYLAQIGVQKEKHE
jgi:SNF2 family DNA or RNA helicase